jgi:hypothetical protein
MMRTPPSLLALAAPFPCCMPTSDSPGVRLPLAVISLYLADLQSHCFLLRAGTGDLAKRRRGRGAKVTVEQEVQQDIIYMLCLSQTGAR